VDDFRGIAELGRITKSALLKGNEDVIHYRYFFIVTLECVLILLFFALWFQYGNYEEVIQQYANLTESSKSKTTTDDMH